MVSSVVAPILGQHNTYRTRHRAPALRWNATVIKSAENWANRCKFEHEQQNLYGENLYASWGNSNISRVALAATPAWYDEIRYYDFSRPGFSYQTGHFSCTQWVASQSLGCAVKQCPDGMTMVVCRYWPVCNVIGQFEKNVLPPM
jgi:uncharacterized protein YkwD